MENTNYPMQLLDRFNRWLQESVTIKLFSIGLLLLILLIPLSWVGDLVHERQMRSGEVTQEITSKWSGRQGVCGPLIVLPYEATEVLHREGGGLRTVTTIRKAFLLPEELEISGKVTPQVLHRGMYEAAVYEAALAISASWARPDLKSLGMAGKVLWEDAYLVLGVSDLRGVAENPSLKYGGKSLVADPTNELGFTYANGASTGLMAKPGWESEGQFGQAFSLHLDIKGSNGLAFAPVGKATTAKISGPWPTPSFNGAFLPDSRTVSPGGFDAEWKVLHFNRPFAQQWAGAGLNLAGADFGVDLLVPVEQYQQSMRTSKYGILIILLTFVSLFLVEISQRVKIHPFQYILMGAALIVYYLLLLGFSEQVGYTASYVVASVATVALLVLYASTFLKSGKLRVLFMSLLAVFYGFIYVIIVQQDYSLITGSVGLFVVIGTLMYLTRKINWYNKAI
ncbi:MAG: cell envelope integrity protein CreD [Cyclobacteriaceae bacterium]|nr:cell envelope integrity protein CreD [Cyclobacteriaceae bacterium]MCB0500859.1 cell envelope integrity protein CreD [Cyclobacteriaceae bacterium]MCB9238440.1 cell envelope integrity protein CreD [Flammeovirgaceae bacterium]MCO5271265.1 cell envelope integrity protein CreD [Cyclobacteriaceae bacterium]MCW5903867.1 cell envelope integrity protein CreD [Cyclobacteriaceae bacterium]